VRSALLEFWDSYTYTHRWTPL